MFVRVSLWLSVLAFGSVASAAELPNILWLSVEDMSPHLGCYGDEHARTPNIDAFAKQSLLYENAFVCAPVCAPCRSSIITGVYPTSLGTHNMRSTVKLPPEIRPFTMYLREAGYYCTNNAKEDYQFQTPKGTWDESSGKAHWGNRLDKDQPFFAVFNYTDTHESAVRGDQPKYKNILARLSPDERHDPASLELPPYYPDTPKVREEWARYYNCITAMDKWFAERLEELEEAGLADDTIVFFWSDHGVGLPRGKRWLYDSGIHVPLIVRVPENFRTTSTGEPDASASGSGDENGGLTATARPGERTDELVSLIDLPPTVLNLAGQAIPTYMQGRAFLGENLLPEREYIYAARDRMDERYDMSRCVRTQRYKYIRNYMPWRPYAQWVSYGEQAAMMQELRRLKAEGKLAREQELFLADSKSIEELYDLETDPHEVVNLLDLGIEFGESRFVESVIRETKQVNREEKRFELLASLEAWREETRDLGSISESELTATERTRFSILREPIGLPIDERREYYFANRALEWGTTPAISLEWVEEGLASSDASYRKWTLRVFDPEFSPTSAGVDRQEWRRLAGHALREARQDSIACVRIAAAEVLIERDEVMRALPVLLDALENADSPWDRLQAANVLDLLPDFDGHAEELRPVVKRVREKLKAESKTGPAEDRQGLGYVERCVDRLAERLGL